MLSDRRFPLAALVCSAGVLFSGAAGHAQAPAAATLDAQMLAKGTQLADQGKFADAAAVFEDLVKKYPASETAPEAKLRAGYAYYNAGKFDEAVTAFQKVLDDKKSPAASLESAASLTPQVLVAKASRLKADDPNRAKALEDAVKQFDVFLAKYPSGDEAESASYGKAMALYQLAKYEAAAAVLKANLQKFAASPTVQDSQFLLALTIGTMANVAMQSAPGENKAAEAQYEEAERLLRDIITKRQNLALANDAQFQVGELLLARGGFTTDKAKQLAVMNRALEAYRSVQSKEYVLDEQQKLVASLIKQRNEAAGNAPVRDKLKRRVEKEQEKLAEFKERADQTVTAKIKCGQIFSELGKNDEARMLMNYLVQAGLATEPEQKKLVDYYLVRSYAAQRLAAKAEEKYAAFEKAYKADPMAQDLPLLMGEMYLGDDPKLADPEKATKHFAEAIALYPNTKAASTAVLMQVRAMIALKNFAEAMKVLDETLAKKPEKDLAVEAEFYRATILAQTGKTAEAVAGYKKVRETYAGTPQAEQAYFQVGQLLAYTDAKAAIGELQSFITKFPNSEFLSSAVFTLGEAQNNAGQKDAALATFKSVSAKFPKSEAAPFAYFKRAKILSENQKLDESLAVLREFIAGYPQSEQLYGAYDFNAQVQTGQGKPEEAIATYAEFVEKHAKDAKSADALLKLSTLWKAHTNAQGPYLAIDETKRAEWKKGVEKSTAAAERVLGDYPDSPAVALALQNLLEVQQLQQKVKLTTEAGVEKYFMDLAAKFSAKPGTRAKIMFTLAAFNFDKDKAKAVQQMAGAYKPDLKFAPEDLDLYGQALIEQKKYDEAIAIYEKLRADYPVAPNGTGPRDLQEAQAIALAGLGKALQEKGDKAGGGAKFAELEKLYAWSPKMLEVNYGIALDLHDKKQDEEAIKRLQNVIKAQKASADLRAKAMFLLGRINEDTGHFSEAIDSYMKISAFYGSVGKYAAEGLWRGAGLMEKQAAGTIPMPTPRPAVKAPPKPKPGA